MTNNSHPPLSMQIRRELVEALTAGPSELLTFPAVDIWAALDNDVIVVDGVGPTGRTAYSLAAGYIGTQPDPAPRFDPATVGDIPVYVFDVPGRVLS